MEFTEQPEPGFFKRNRIFFKGIIIGILMLFMIIPAALVNELVRERKQRQIEIVAEVSSKWSDPQTVAGPFIYVPYTFTSVNADGKSEVVEDFFWLLPEELNVDGNIEHHIRKRSIFDVLLYNARLNNSGSFRLKVPDGIDNNAVKWKDAKICLGISDFRGIEEKIVVNLKGRDYELSPGLPSERISTKGLSAPLDLSTDNLGDDISFKTTLNLKGSENIKFLPLSGNSIFTIKSSWPSPSFIGSTLPKTRTVSDKGFTAEWKFNKANLPFNTVLKDVTISQLNLDFGITLLQPTDQYAKTERCAKYAILFIGLTFGLFFIVEITQKKPVHPIQYILIGIALAIFYTLLLSISEFIHFDIAYLIAAVSIITMISLYSKQLFRSNRSSLLTGGILTMQYAFIFVLIRLEDTALLVGSIGLFIVVGIVMYASRKIDWYGTKEVRAELQ